MSESYFVVYKPFQVMSQFSPVEGKQTLADYFDVPKDVYPVGRLDHDSEGLLLLTNDKTLNHQILNPDFKHEREYWVQVEGTIDQHALLQLEKGVMISIDGKMHKTLPAKTSQFDGEPRVPERNPPIRFRKNIPTSWFRLVIYEGKNRQVRKMTAAAGFPTLRLIRYRVGKLTVQGLEPGDMAILTRGEIYKALSLK
jgi:23S rRNA pseudouridine2457 synthase